MQSTLRRPKRHFGTFGFLEISYEVEGFGLGRGETRGEGGERGGEEGRKEGRRGEGAEVWFGLSGFVKGLDSRASQRLQQFLQLVDKRLQADIAQNNASL